MKERAVDCQRGHALLCACLSLALCASHALAQDAPHADAQDPPPAETGSPDAGASAADAGAHAPPPPNDTAASAVPIEVTVRSAPTDQARRLAGSSAAILVVDMRAAEREAADLGAVLARQQGINVQRAGGLGAQTRISLQGLGEDQIRFYVDGVPLAFTGLPESVAYVPLDFVLRAEIYRGVVPIRFGGDTLGGAIHLVQHPPEPGAHGSASLTLGSFDTQRAALRAQYLDPKSGLYVSTAGFLDHARNDYGMNDVEVPQPNGKRAPRRVYRLHDAYRAGFGQLELGVLDRPYAKRLALRGFVSAYDKEINHDVLMNNPYGEVLSRRRTQGALLLYEHELWRRFGMDAKLGYAHRARQLRDLGECAYDWYLNCRSELANGGEISGLPANRKTAEHDLFLRLNLSLRLSRLLQFRVSLAPSYVKSNSYDAAVASGIPDPFAQDRQLFGFVSGLEYELDAFGGRLENVLFAKDYVQKLWSDATATEGPISIDKSYHRAGVGNALRVRLHDMLIGKLSYELGARMPDGNEVFGDGALVDPNLALKPESSHNLNIELRFAHAAPRAGSAELAATGFFRRVSDFIFLLPGPSVAQFQNLAEAEVKGVEGSGRYTSPGEYLSLDGAVTWQDMRNHATSGPFARFEGGRIPNRPYLFANLSLTGKLRQIAAEHDSLALTFRENFVEQFYRAFEVKGASERDLVPRQLVSSLILTYETELRARTLSASVECNNLTDAEVYDFFGVKRPGRSVLARLMFRM